MARGRQLSALGLGLVLIVVFPVLTATSAHAATVIVNPGQSIQAAVDAAAPGTTIVVRPGTYFENVEIYKDNLVLLGAGIGRTILRPPANPVQRFCTPDPNDPIFAGICATGEIDFETALVDRFLHRTRISGFSVEGFPGVGILVIGVEDAVVELNESADNGARGIMAFNSTRTRVAGNLLRGNFMAGIWVDTFAFVNAHLLPPSKAIVVGNLTRDNLGSGVFVFDAREGIIAGNVMTGNCSGIILGNFSGDGARNWTVTLNVASRNNADCFSEGGVESGVGIALLGGADVDIEHNVTRENQPSGPSFVASGGIVVQTSADFGGVDPGNVRVRHNISKGNLPADLVWDGTGTGITFANNVCATSDPAELCGGPALSMATTLSGSTRAAVSPWQREYVSKWRS